MLILQPRPQMDRPPLQQRGSWFRPDRVRGIPHPLARPCPPRVVPAPAPTRFGHRRPGQIARGTGAARGAAVWVGLVGRPVFDWPGQNDTAAERADFLHHGQRQQPGGPLGVLPDRHQPDRRADRLAQLDGKPLAFVFGEAGERFDLHIQAAGRSERPRPFTVWSESRHDKPVEHLLQRRERERQFFEDRPAFFAIGHPRSRFDRTTRSRHADFRDRSIGWQPRRAGQLLAAA